MYYRQIVSTEAELGACPVRSRQNRRPPTLHRASPSHLQAGLNCTVQKICLCRVRAVPIWDALLGSFSFTDFQKSDSKPFRGRNHPGGNRGANIQSISHRCHPILVAFAWKLKKETIHLPLGWPRSGRTWTPLTSLTRFFFPFTFEPRVERYTSLSALNAK